MRYWICSHRHTHTHTFNLMIHGAVSSEGRFGPWLAKEWPLFIPLSSHRPRRNCWPRMLRPSSVRWAVRDQTSASFQIISWQYGWNFTKKMDRSIPSCSLFRAVAADFLYSAEHSRRWSDNATRACGHIDMFRRNSANYIFLHLFFCDLFEIGLTFLLSQAIRGPHDSRNEMWQRLMDLCPHVCGCGSFREHLAHNLVTLHVYCRSHCDRLNVTCFKGI